MNEADVAAARPAVAAINAISRNDLTPEVFAHLLSVMSAQVERASWSHTNEAEIARGVLDNLSDDITAGCEL